VTVRNGLTLAYTVALINAALAVMIAFGVAITNEQNAAIVGFVNAAVLVAARVLHLPERTADGGTVVVSHVPVLTTQGPVQTTHGAAGETVVTPLPATSGEPVV
jgi:hypothetical protein